MRVPRSQLGPEAAVIGALSWLVAFPVGIFSIRIALRAMLPIAMLSAGPALWLPGRRLLGLQVIEAVRQE